MARISGERSLEVFRETISTDEPSPGNYMDVKEILLENRDTFSTNDLNISFNREIVPKVEYDSEMERDTTTYVMYETLKVTENDRPESDEWESSKEHSFDHSKKSKISESAANEVYLRKMSAVFYKMAQNVLRPFNELPCTQTRVCQGHDVVNFIAKSKDKRKYARKLSKEAIETYSKCKKYRNFISSSIGLEDRNRKFRFIFRVFHKHNHNECDNFDIQFKSDNPEGLEASNKKIKKCLGHATFLKTFPCLTSANAALRRYSHNMLEVFKEKDEIKSDKNSILETHALQHIKNTGRYNDLFIFYHHKDGCDKCDRYCFVPESIGKLVSKGVKGKKLPNKNSDESDVLGKSWEEKLVIAEKEAGLIPPNIPVNADPNLNPTSVEPLVDQQCENSFTSRFFQKAKDKAAEICHEIVDHVQEFKVQALKENEFINKIIGKFLPENTLDDLKINTYEDQIAYVNELHQEIDTKFSTNLDWKYQDGELKHQGVAIGIMPAPYELLGRLKVPKTLVNETKGWKVGQALNNATKLGACPTWSTVRRRHWKNKAYLHEKGLIKTTQVYEATPENIARMKKGLAPQRLNPNKMKYESAELHHTPAQRHGGKFNFEEVWPEDHAAKDPFRRIKKL